MDLYHLDISSYSETNMRTKMKEMIDYGRDYGHVVTVDTTYEYTATDKSAPHGEIYGTNVNVVMDDLSYEAIKTLIPKNPNLMINIIPLKYDVPSPNEKKHELFINMVELAPAIAEVKGDEEDYHRNPDVYPWVNPWVISGREISPKERPKEMAKIILSRYVVQAVKKYTDIGFNRQPAYVQQIVDHMTTDIFTILKESSLFFNDTIQSKDKNVYTITKLVAAVIVKTKEVIVNALNDILYKHIASNKLYNVDDLIYEINVKISGDLLANANSLTGYHRTKQSLSDNIYDMLHHKLKSTVKNKKQIVEYLRVNLPNVLLDSIDASVKYLNAKDSVSYYALSLIVLDEIEDTLIKSSSSGNWNCKLHQKCEPFEIISNMVKEVAYTETFNYLLSIYPYHNSINIAVIGVLTKDLNKKLNVAVKAGILNKGDHEIDFYITDDAAGISYGFINFKQNVTPFQVGVTKAILEGLSWSFIHSDHQDILLKINKLKSSHPKI